MWLLGFIRHMINDNSFRIRSSRAVLVRGQVQFSHFFDFLERRPLDAFGLILTIMTISDDIGRVGS